MATNNEQKNNEQKNDEQKNAQQVQITLPTLPADLLSFEHTFVKSDFYLQTSHKQFQSEHMHDYARVELTNGSYAFVYLVALLYDFKAESTIPYVYVVDMKTMRFIPKCIALNMNNVAGIFSRRKKSERKAKQSEATMSADDLLNALS